MFVILLIYAAGISASLIYDKNHDMGSPSYRSHCSVLVEIWKEMGGYSPLDPETVKDNECCSYKSSLIPGILCSQMNFVVEIVWTNAKLEGEIPPIISRLIYLAVLVVFNNRITAIPSEIGALTSLEVIDISGNQVSQMPSTMGRLHKLKVLNLSNNKISSIEPWIGNFPYLERLYLKNNQLASEIPEEIKKLDSLQYLILSNNYIVGVIPEEIGQLQNLRDLYLNDNYLTGSIPKALQTIGSLRDIKLSGNSFTNTDALDSGIPKRIGCSSTVLDCRLRSL